MEGEDDPSKVDWSRVVQEQGFRIEDEAWVKTYPWSDVYHEVTWWITRPLTLGQWSALDDAETEAFKKVGIENNVVGTAGPIPFGEEWAEAVEKWRKENEEASND